MSQALRDALFTLGLEVDGASATRLANALAETNGTRKVRLLAEEDIVETARAALTAPEMLAVRHGGESNQGTQRTTLCMAVRDENTLTIGIALSGAQGAGPGRTWKTLQPWSRNDPAKNREKLVGWARAKAADRVRFIVDEQRSAGAKTPRRSDLAVAALHTAILASPDEDEPRAMIADRLSDAGDPRGEFIALQLALARRDDPEAAARAAALERAHRRLWTADLAQITHKQIFRRGFVEHIELEARRFASDAEKLFALAPIRSVTLRAAELPQLRAIVKRPELARLRRLALDRTIGDAGARLLASAPLSSLRELRLSYSGISVDGFARLLKALPKLEWLELEAIEGGLARLVEERRKAGAPLRVRVDRRPSDPLALRLVDDGAIVITFAE